MEKNQQGSQNNKKIDNIFRKGIWSQEEGA